MRIERTGAQRACPLRTAESRASTRRSVSRISCISRPPEPVAWLGYLSCRAGAGMVLRHPHGHYIGWFQEALKAEVDTLGFVGLVRRYKVVETLIERFRHTKKRLPQTVFRVCGDSTNESMRQEVERLVAEMVASSWTCGTCRSRTSRLHSCRCQVSSCPTTSCTTHAQCSRHSAWNGPSSSRQRDEPGIVIGGRAYLESFLPRWPAP